MVETEITKVFQSQRFDVPQLFPGFLPTAIRSVLRPEERFLDNVLFLEGPVCAQAQQEEDYNTQQGIVNLGFDKGQDRKGTVVINVGLAMLG
jgi:hypothetical protein